jgi:TonB family protein
MPVGGNSTFREFVKNNLRYPASGLEDEIKGMVKLKFTVGSNGQISNMEVLKSLGEDFDREAIRLVNEGPKWEPAKENGRVVERDVKVKIRFRPPE